MCHCACCGEQTAPKHKKRFGPLALLFNLAIAWLVLVVGGGTLIRTGHPVAIETGRIIHTVTFVEPTIHWADGRGMYPVANGLRLVSAGLPIERVLPGGSGA
ncbi:MAG: hypothetical protein ACYS0D_04405 [Planctomycetota bacterium]|jgi:hypothetical protein